MVFLAFGDELFECNWSNLRSQLLHSSSLRSSEAMKRKPGQLKIRRKQNVRKLRQSAKAVLNRDVKKRKKMKGNVKSLRKILVLLPSLSKLTLESLS